MLFSLGNAFIPSQRKQIPTLYEISKQKVKAWITRSFDERGNLVVDIGKARKHIRKLTMPLIREQLLEEMLPFEDHWQYCCLKTKKRINCRIHPECQVMFNNCSRILKYLFSSDVEKLNLNLRKISTNNLEDSLRALTRIVRMSSFCRLREISLIGGSLHVDEYLHFMEDLCSSLEQKAPRLTKLHLPIGSNKCLQSIGLMPQLQSLIIERSRQLTCEGLIYLCDDNSSTKFYLKNLHIGKFWFILIQSFFLNQNAYKILF